MKMYLCYGSLGSLQVGLMNQAPTEGRRFHDFPRDKVKESIPLRRIPPLEDVAGPILFLASGLARHITGEVLNVNGGSVLCA
jgi:3-oxoacyl-[acyl-carrier protein] reductase